MMKRLIVLLVLISLFACNAVIAGEIANNKKAGGYTIETSPTNSVAAVVKPDVSVQKGNNATLFVIQPDLVPIKKGGVTTLTDGVKIYAENKGTGSAKEMPYLLQLRQQNSTTSATLKKDTYGTKLSPGTTVKIFLPLNDICIPCLLPNGPEKEYGVYVVLDPDNKIKELNESNNELEIGVVRIKGSA